MTKTYNLYFGEEAVEYYTPPTPEDELQTLIDDPARFTAFKKDYEDKINSLKDQRDNLAKDKVAIQLLSANRKKSVDGFNEFLKNDLGFASVADVKALLGEQKLNDILVRLYTENRVLSENSAKLARDMGILNTQMAEMVDRELLIAESDKTKKAINDLANLQNTYNALRGYIDNLNTKWGVANLDLLDTKIRRYYDERNEERDKIKQTRTPLKRIADKISSWKVVMKGKKEMKEDINAIADIFRFGGSVIAIDDESDNET